MLTVVGVGLGAAVVGVGDGAAAEVDVDAGDVSDGDVVGAPLVDVSDDGDVDDWAGSVDDVAGGSVGSVNVFGSTLIDGNVGSGAPGGAVAAGSWASTLTVSSCHWDTSSALR